MVKKSGGTLALGFEARNWCRRCWTLHLRCGTHTTKKTFRWRRSSLCAIRHAVQADRAPRRVGAVAKGAHPGDAAPHLTSLPTFWWPIPYLQVAALGRYDEKFRTQAPFRCITVGDPACRGAVGSWPSSIPDQQRIRSAGAQRNGRLSGGHANAARRCRTCAAPSCNCPGA